MVIGERLKSLSERRVRTRGVGSLDLQVQTRIGTRNLAIRHAGRSFSPEVWRTPSPAKRAASGSSKTPD